jgi:hypothetical protein
VLFSWYLLFETPLVKYSVDVSMMIFYSTFSEDYVTYLFCSSPAFAYFLIVSFLTNSQLFWNFWSSASNIPGLSRCIKCQNVIIINGKLPKIDAMSDCQVSGKPLFTDEFYNSFAIAFEVKLTNE